MSLKSLKNISKTHNKFHVHESKSKYSSHIQEENQKQIQITKGMYGQAEEPGHQAEGELQERATSKKQTTITKNYDLDQARDVHSRSLGLQKWSVKVQQAAQLESKHGET